MKTIIVGSSQWPTRSLLLKFIFLCFWNSRSHKTSDAVFVKRIRVTMERTLVLSILSKNIHISKMMFFVFFKKACFLIQLTDMKLACLKLVHSSLR